MVWTVETRRITLVLACRRRQRAPTSSPTTSQFPTSLTSAAPTGQECHLGRWTTLVQPCGQVTEGRFYGIDGTMPTEIGLSTSLTVLHQDSDLMGTLPSELGQLTALTSLTIETNKLTGTLPTEIGRLTALTALMICDNYELSGSLPSEIGHLTFCSTS